MTRRKLSDRPIDEGIYILPSTRYAVIWREHLRNKEKHFPADTPVKALRAFRTRQLTRVADAAPTGDDVTGSFVRDVVTFLRTRKHRPSYASDRSHMKPWIAVFGRFSRHAVTAMKITAALATWGDKSARERRHRANVLRQFFNFHDGERFTMGLFVDVQIPTVPDVEPVGVHDTVIQTVAARLADSQRRGYLRDGKTLARFLVEATCGKRPCQIQRARPGDVDLDARVWAVRPAKQSRGGRLYLNDQMVAAWRAFIAADAWATDEATWDRVAYVKTLQRNGWPTGVRPYNMRHQTLQTLTDEGVDFGAVQQAAGHTSPDTTRRNYVPFALPVSKRASLAIAGRFTDTMFAPVVRTKPPRRSRDTNADVGKTAPGSSERTPLVVEAAASIPTQHTNAGEGMDPAIPENIRKSANAKTGSAMAPRHVPRRKSSVLA